jgi:hypothetical protein
MAADADNTFEDGTEKGDASSGADNAVDKPLENGIDKPFAQFTTPCFLHCHG